MTVYDVAYALGLGAAAPVWMARRRWRTKVLDALLARTGDFPARDISRPAVLIHAVSVGEINATTSLVRLLSAARPDLRFIVSTTSLTGSNRARELYGKNPKVTLIRYPFDFSASIARLMESQRPAVAVLMELELWPNFMLACARHGVPVVLVNGRLSAHSYRGYRLASLFTRPMFRRLAFACVQEETYARRFSRAGVRPSRIRVTGTMKFDTAEIAHCIEGADRLAEDVGLSPGQEPIWVCGSTGPGEEEILLDVHAQLLRQFPKLRLVLVPRHPERFDAVAGMIESRGLACVRRSRSRSDAGQPAMADKNVCPTRTDSPCQSVMADKNVCPTSIILGDTMGELRKFYSLGDVVFVGRSLLDLGAKQHGSDMIEPAALGKPVIVGPFTGNFAEVMNRFREAGAIREVADAGALREAVSQFLASPESAAEVGARARQVVRDNQGATAAHVQVILEQMSGGKRTGG